MVMVGDMFNNALKARVDALCAELAGLLPAAGLFAPAVASRQSQSQGQPGGIGVSLFVPGSLASAEWWPAELGSPASVGAQNELRYAFFPAMRRLAIARDGQVTVYDTGRSPDRRILPAERRPVADLHSQHGLVRLADLPVVGGSAAPAAPAPAAPATPAGADDIFARIERLAALRAKDILTAQEFETKKAELLSRL